MSDHTATPSDPPPGTPDVITPDMEYVPSPFVKFLRKHIWTIGIVFGVVMITAIRPFLMRRPPPPPVLTELPAFTLLDANGNTFTRDDMRGTVWVVGFVFTRCAGPCPAVSQAMASFQENYVDASRIDRDDLKLMTVTVDPEFDTPAVLRRYADEIGADRDGWVFLTGELDEVTGLVEDGFKKAVGTRTETGPGIFDIAHSTKLALVDRWGGVRGFYDINTEGLTELYNRAFAVMRVEEGE